MFEVTVKVVLAMVPEGTPESVQLVGLKVRPAGTSGWMLQLVNSVIVGRMLTSSYCAFTE